MNLLKSEWIKLTTTKSAYWLYGLAIVFSVGIAALIGQFEETATGDPMAGPAPSGSDPLFALLGVGVFTVYLVWIAAIVAVTGEYRYHTIKTTFLAAPKRWPAILAKTVLFVAASMIVTVLAVILSFLVARMLSGVDSWTAFSGDGFTLMWRYAVHTGLGTLAMIGLAYIMRNAAGAIALVLVWTLGVETMIVMVPEVGETLAGWMPFANGDFWTQGEVAQGAITWGEWTAFAWYAAVCAALWVIGLAMTLRRDA